MSKLLVYLIVNAGLQITTGLQMLIFIINEKKESFQNKKNVYYNLDRIKYSISNDKSFMDGSNTSSINKLDGFSYDDSQIRK